MSELENVYNWADGIKAALNSPDLAHKVKDEEAIIAGFILAGKENMEELKESLKQEYPEGKYELIFEDLQEI